MKTSRQRDRTSIPLMGGFLALFLAASGSAYACGDSADASPAPEDQTCVGVSHDSSMERVYKESAYVFLARCTGDDKVVVEPSGMIWNEAICQPLKVIKGESPGVFVLRADSMSAAGSMLAWNAKSKALKAPRHKSTQFVFSFDEGPKDGVKYLSSSEQDGIRAIQVSRGTVYLTDGVFKLYNAKTAATLPPFAPVKIEDFIYSLQQIH